MTIDHVRRIAHVPCKSCDWYRRVGDIGASCAMHEQLATLAHNLAIGAALCRAAVLGPLKRASAHEPHAFAGDGYDCEICDGGACYYLHTDRPEYEP